MEKCENCGNTYDKAFEITMAGRKHIFDSFECAINTLAPVCTHCKTKIIGHGVESEEKFYCCVHCAEADGTPGLRDRN